MWLSDTQSNYCLSSILSITKLLVTISPQLNKTKLTKMFYFITFNSLSTFYFSFSLFFHHVEIGVGLTAFGVFFMLLGVMMFFDGGLLAIGNVILLLYIIIILSIFPPINLLIGCVHLGILKTLDFK